MAVAALLDVVVVGELLPVPLLLGAEDARAPAEGAAVVEGPQDGIPYEGRTVGHALEGRNEFLVRLEGDDLFFPRHASIETDPGPLVKAAG